VELRQLVEEQDAVVGQADLAGRRGAAAADHAGVATGVVRVDGRRVDGGNGDTPHGSLTGGRAPGTPRA
jgi:hypothetical protein